MFLVEGSSETGLFRHFSNRVFGVDIFQNTKAVTVIFFSKCLKFKLDLKNAVKNCKKNLVSEIIASVLVSLNSLYEEQDTFHQKPTCEQAVPRFCMSIRETFSDWTDFPVINEYHKRAAMQISKVLGRVYHVACGRVLWNGAFEIIVWLLFQSP